MIRITNERKIYGTKHYEDLKLMNEENSPNVLNREYTDNSSKKNIKELKKSILRDGQLRPIVVNRDGLIYGGQHRYVAMTQLIEEDLYSDKFDGTIWFEYTDLEYREYQMSENTEKKHTTQDKLRTLSNGDVQKFMRLYGDYKLRNGNFAMYAMAQWGDGNGSGASVKIKNGEYTVNDWDTGYSIMKRLDEINIKLKAYANKRIGANEYNTVYKMITHNEYCHERFLDKIESFFANNQDSVYQWKKLPRQQIAVEDFFMKIYNYKVKKNYINLFSIV